MKKNLSFQEIIIKLQEFWATQGCVVQQPYDMELGAGTFHPTIFFHSLGPDPWRVAYVQPCRRPTDGRYGDNPNRLQHYYQFQVLLKPSPENSQDIYLESFKHLGIDPLIHDIRFVEDDWESPTLGASGLGWEVWCDGMEIAQYTYFQQVGGYECSPVSVEYTYGLERLAMMIQGVDSIFDIDWNGAQGDLKMTYRDVFHRNEREFSAYNFEHANTDLLLQHFSDVEEECHNILKQKLPLPAYDQCIKASHLFNLLEARGIVSVTERAGYIARVRSLAKECLRIWLVAEGHL